jgi:hypothetical protein
MGDLAKTTNAYFEMIKQAGGTIPQARSKAYNPVGEVDPTTIYEDISQWNTVPRQRVLTEAETGTAASPMAQPDLPLDDLTKDGKKHISTIKHPDAQGLMNAKDGGYWVMIPDEYPENAQEVFKVMYGLKVTKTLKNDKGILWAYIPKQALIKFIAPTPAEESDRNATPDQKEEEPKPEPKPEPEAEESSKTLQFPDEEEI